MEKVEKRIRLCRATVLVLAAATLTVYLASHPLHKTNDLVWQGVVFGLSMAEVAAILMWGYFLAKARRDLSRSKDAEN